MEKLKKKKKIDPWQNVVIMIGDRVVDIARPIKYPLSRGLKKLLK